MKKHGRLLISILLLFLLIILPQDPEAAPSSIPIIASHRSSRPGYPGRNSMAAGAMMIVRCSAMKELPVDDCQRTVTSPCYRAMRS